MTLGRVAQQDPADADLDVVGMRADREHDVLPGRAALARDGDERARLLDHVGGIERLGDVVVGARAHRRDRVIERAVAGEDQRRQLRPTALDTVHQLESVDPGQVDVADHQVPVAALGDLERLLGARGPVHVAEAAQQLHEQGSAHLVVFDEEDACGGGIRHVLKSSLKISRAIMALVPSYSPPAGDPIGDAVRGRAWTYDSAITAAALALPVTSTARARSLTACKRSSVPTARSTPPTTCGRGSCGPAAFGQPGVGGSCRAGVGRHERLVTGVTRWLLDQREEHGLVRGGPDVYRGSRRSITSKRARCSRAR